jgi:polyisoprenoid-binding protein YceI
MRRGLVVAVVGCAGLLALGGAAAALLVGSHRAPPPLALSTPAAGASQSDLVGTWTVAAGSQAGYRVKERFINQPATTEAVARTDKVTGSFVVTASGGGLVATHIHLTVDLTSLVSQDRYATYQAYQRDFFVRNIYLETNRYPTADFTADSVRLPADTNGPASFKVSGKLGVHGVTRTVVAELQAQPNGAQVEVAGSIQVDMRDFGIAPPDISFTTAESQVQIEYHLLLTRA